MRNVQEILKKRAEELSKPLKVDEGRKDLIEVVLFNLSDEVYGIEAEYVREIYPVGEVTKLPGVPEYIYGVMNVRRKIIPIIDLKFFFGLNKAKNVHNQKVIILEQGEMEFAVLTDKIIDIRFIPSHNLQSGIPTLTGVRQEFLKGITPERFIILDGDKLLNDNHLVIEEE